ncbi:hypothetical protein L6452_27977 [Arctium lappa]|uniref:Uncharacterized protein n=1 Tax=Arctium lappa TaxID=4217 RepID=A0ACB8ZW75_ARCLA|nr:hypothetical protein L6452_27977 [Arctium lappa]
MFQKNNVNSSAFNSSDIQIDENKGLPPTTSPNPVKGKIITELVVGLIVGSFVLITSLVVLGFFIRRKKKKSQEDEAEGHGFDVEMNNEFELGGPRRFSYLELARRWLVGEDGFAMRVVLGQESKDGGGGDSCFSSSLLTLFDEWKCFFLHSSSVSTGEGDVLIRPA